MGKENSLMQLRKITSALLAVLLSIQLAPAALAEGSAPRQAQAELKLNTSEHVKFMSGEPDGLFHPEDSILRAEAAQIFCNLLVDPPPAAASYPDLPAGEWYAGAVSLMGGLGALRTDFNGLIRPEDPITRGEFAWMLSFFLPSSHQLAFFLDVPASYWAHDAVMASAACGIFSGYSDGTFRPREYMTRSEAAAAMCRLLGRSADLAALSASAAVCIFPDVPQDYWAYGPIMEASVTHSHEAGTGGSERWTQIEPRRTVLADGYHTINGRLYRVQNGMFLRSATVDGFTYDADGRYTTGSEYLDRRLPEIISECTNSSMTRDQKLRALYNYVRDNYRYRKRALVDKDAADWENGYAEDFLEDGTGNCFSYAAAYCLLARQLGLPAYTVVGKLHISITQDHGWVEIPLDGKTYLFDVELEWSYRYKHNRPIDLFKIDLDNLPFTYVR